MAIMKKTLFAVVATLFVLVGCESHENDSKYRSYYPIIEDMVFESLVTGTNRVVAGEPFVATVKQAQLGHLLYGAEYVWSDGREEGTHSPFPKSVVYDANPINPTDTIVMPNSGRQQIKMVATYKISGGYDASAAAIVDIPDGRVQYDVPSWQYYKVTVTKNVYVNPAPSVGEE